MKMIHQGHLRLQDDFIFPLYWLRSHMLITGIYGIGGRKLLQKIAWDVHKHHPEIGILYISQLSTTMKHYYPWDEYHDNRDFKLSVPYFHGSNQDAQNLKKGVAAFCRPLGFSRYLEQRLTTFMKSIELPVFFSDLLGQFERYEFEAKVLPPEEYYEFCYLPESFKGRRLDKLFQLNTGKIEWVERLLCGEKIFVDVSGFAYGELLSALILQTLRSNLPVNALAHPKILIITEQGAHIVFNRTSWYRDDNDLYNRFVRHTLRDLEGKGVSLLLEEDQPTNLVRSICEDTKVKIFFRHHDVDLECLPLTNHELQSIRDLHNQEALVYSSKL